ncbi:MAG: hypothetical protein WC495_01045 [Patescibacteria group bacterium]|jgi:hypothetical protein
MTIKDNQLLPPEYQKIVGMILGSETQKMLPTGIMFYGPKETAKNIIADELSNCLLQKKNKEIHPDELILEPKLENVNIGIEDVREFISSFSSSPLVASRRVGIIRSADMLTIQSQNALLKTLEEPPQQSCMMLIADDATKILPTVQSRLTKIYIPTLSQNSYQLYLHTQHIAIPTKELLSYCVGRVERTIQMQKTDDSSLALFAKEVYQNIRSNSTRIFLYTQKNKKIDSHDLTQCIPYLIHCAHQDLFKNSGDSFSRHFLSALLEYVTHPLNRNLQLKLENVCLQD